MRPTFFADLKASLLVFLVALPLALGVAQASGYPPVAGLITSIVGGLVVGWVSGAPLQVSGAAAGLSALIFALVLELGIETTSLAIALAGLLQVLFGLARTGKYFRLVSKTVVEALLCAIGLLIIAAQIQVLCDHKPAGTLLGNLSQLPQTLATSLNFTAANPHSNAFSVGLATLALIQVWNWLPRRLAFNLPGSLVALLSVTLASNFLELPIQKISLPSNPFATLQLLKGEALQSLLTASVWLAAIKIALIASAESILSAVASERLVQGQRNDCNRELLAQGLGNSLCGLLGALPMTGVIVRTAANIQAGAKTRLATMLHGLWCLLALLVLAGFLNKIPSAALAAVLVQVGWKLLPLRDFIKLARDAKAEAGIFLVTVLAILSFDMLVGIGLGVLLSVLNRLLRKPQQKAAAQPHFNEG